jgi:hexosaminidase
MKLIVLKILISFLVSVTCLSQDKSVQVSLMPVPSQYELTGSKFRLDASFSISVNSDKNSRVYKAAFRMLNRIAGRTGIFLTNPFVMINENSASMFIESKHIGEVQLGEDESYDLLISEAKILLKAETDLGALRGIETFLQLLDADEEGYFFHTINVKDKPRFQWRGLMIDACRHFMPAEVIKRNLDGMAAVKLNVLHWHLSEDQGFRVECKTFPKLHELGSDGDYYTQEQIKEIIKYADDRGIRVMPEFDLPGHATSWLTAYPEFASLPGPYSIERNWGIFDPTFNPVIEETYEFLDKFFQEMSVLFPDEYMHIGGDENNGRQWDANPEIQKFMIENNIPDNHTLQSYFNSRLLNILTKYNKKLIGWDEIFHPDLPKNIVIHSWRGKESLVEAARLGYQGILSKDFYIDLNQSTVHHYLNDPLPEDIPLTEEEKKLVLGGEATMWAEFVSPENVDSRIWPRTAAIAERLWSSGSVKDTLDMYRRLDEVSFRLEELGLLHIKNYDMMLRRLTNNSDITSLKNLVDVIEPVKIYRRNRLRKQTQQSPLTRVVDAAGPDAKVAREFRMYVDQFLSGDNRNLEDIKSLLTLWENNHSNLLMVIKKSPVLKEIESASEDLSKIASAGNEAIQYILNNRKPNQEWLISNMEIIKKAKEPHAQTEIMVVDSIEKLINRAAEL